MSKSKPTTGRTLGLWMCTALVVGNMIGSGVFLLPASLAQFGSVGLFGWVFTTAGALLVATVFSRLVRLVPAAGGPYAFAREGFGDFPGFLVAWGYWISIWAGNAAIAIAFTGYMAFFFPILDPAQAGSGVPAALCSLTTVWVVTFINCKGIRTAGLVQLAMTILKLLPLLAVAFVGIFFIEMDNFKPFSTGQSHFSAITSSAALTLWAFLGLESATIPSKAVINPEVTIPRATMIGVLIAAGVYVAGSVAVMGVVPHEMLVVSTAPFADAATNMWGSWAGYMVAFGAIASSFGALNGWILISGQLPLAVAQDGMFPKALSRVSQNGTPITGLVVTSVIVTLIMSMNYTNGLVEQFNFIILLATLNTLVPYIFSCMAELVLLARKGVFKPQPGLGLWGYVGLGLTVGFVLVGTISGFAYPQVFLILIFLSLLLTLSGWVQHRTGGPAILCCFAFAYVLWAIVGSGKDAVYWGFLLLMAGVPVYVWMHWSRHAEKDKRGVGT